MNQSGLGERTGEGRAADDAWGDLPLFEPSHRIAALRDRIEELKSRLVQEEPPTPAQVLEGVVEPLLAQLGWELADPPTVIRGFGTGPAKVDLALCHPPGTPRILVRIDAAGVVEPGHDGHPFDDRSDGALQLEVSGCGRKWAVHFPAGRGSVRNREFARFEIGGDADAQVAYEVAKQMETLLSLHAVKSGRALDCAERLHRDRRFPAEAVAAWRRALSGPAILDLFLAEMKRATGVHADRAQAERFVRGQFAALEWPADPPDPQPTRRVAVGDDVWVFDFASRNLERYRLVDRPVDDDGRRQHVAVTAGSAFGHALLGVREGECTELALPGQEAKRLRVVLIRRE